MKNTKIKKQERTWKQSFTKQSFPIYQHIREKNHFKRIMSIKPNSGLMSILIPQDLLARKYVI